MMVKRFGMLLMIAALVLGAQISWAKGPPQKVTITGGDLPHDIEITDDRDVLDALQMMTLEVYDTRSPYEPLDIAAYGDSSGEGYLITRYYVNSLTGEYVAFDELRYYPAHDGGQGYLRYVGIVNGRSEYDGEWFRPSANGEATLQWLIDQALGVTSPRPAPSITASRNLHVLVTGFAALIDPS